MPGAFDLPDLTGQVAVVTGASKGLGAGLASRFASLGMHLGLCARTEPTTPPGARSVTTALDVTDAEAVESFGREIVAELGGIDLWINNAGVLEPMGPQRNHRSEDVERALLVNVGGVANGTRTFTRLASPRPGRPASLINISSGASTSIYSGWSIYGATKAAVNHFTEIVASEEPALRCHAVAPGVVDTEMQAQIRDHDASTFPAIDRFNELHRTGAWNSPAWVADHILAIHTGRLEPDGVVYRVPTQPATQPR